jgi:hypothetical protein
MGEGGGRRGMSTFLYLGSSQIINDTPPPNKTRKKNLLMQFLMPSLIQRVVLIPLMQKFLLRHICIYLFIRTKRSIMKVKIYKGFTYVHCIFVVAVIEDEEH